MVGYLVHQVVVVLLGEMTAEDWSVNLVPYVNNITYTKIFLLINSFGYVPKTLTIPGECFLVRRVFWEIYLPIMWRPPPMPPILPNPNPIYDMSILFCLAQASSSARSVAILALRSVGVRF